MISKKMKTAAAVLFAVFAVAAVVAPAFAVGADTPDLPPLPPAVPERVADWDGWTFDQSQYEQFSQEWVEDVKAHVYQVITEPGKSFDDRLKAQAYILGWDDRFDIVERYGTIDYETGEITYEFGFWENIFGVGIDSGLLFYTVEEYNAAMGVYMQNYNTCVQAVPREV